MVIELLQIQYQDYYQPVRIFKIRIELLLEKKNKGLIFWFLLFYVLYKIQNDSHSNYFFFIYALFAFTMFLKI